MEYTNICKERIEIAKEYLYLVSEKMHEAFIEAYIYGSVAKNAAHEKSDVDIILIIKQPTKQEWRIMNSTQGGMWEPQRQGIWNFAHNSHYIFYYKYELEKKYGIEISPYYHFSNQGLDELVKETPFTLGEILEGPHIRYDSGGIVICGI